MKILILLLILGISVSGQEKMLCPSCKKECTNVSKLKDDLTKPSKNLSVWNRSMCANMQFYYFICEKDFYAYELNSKTWNLSLEDKDKFPIKLHKSIRDTPLAKATKSRKVYSQTIYNDRKEESLTFWFTHDENYLKTIRAYAQEHGLKLDLDLKRLKEESFLSISREEKLERGLESKKKQ